MSGGGILIIIVLRLSLMFVRWCCLHINSAKMSLMIVRGWFMYNNGSEIESDVCQVVSSAYQ